MTTETNVKALVLATSLATDLRGMLSPAVEKVVKDYVAGDLAEATDRDLANLADFLLRSLAGERAVWVAEGM